MDTGSGISGEANGSEGSAACGAFPQALERQNKMVKMMLLSECRYFMVPLLKKVGWLKEFFSGCDFINPSARFSLAALYQERMVS